MAIIRPFKAFRPKPELCEKVAELPYDVLDREQALKLAKDNPYSFLHVDKSEIDLDPSVNPYDDIVYKKAAENLNKLISDGVLIQDTAPCYYIYSLTTRGRTQTGLVACSSIDDYLNSVIKRHEFTLSAKQQDRIRHVDTLDANTGPIFLACRRNASLSDTLKSWMGAHKPVCDFTTNSGLTNKVWVINDASVIDKLTTIVSGINALYIADGHHRTASAAEVGQMRRKAHPGYTGNEEFNYFLSVIFPSDELLIVDYNRVVADLNGNTTEQFFGKLAENFTVAPYEGKGSFSPKQKRAFGMYLENKWYQLTAKPHICDDTDPEKGLDVWILQNYLLDPILGIQNPRTDKRIECLGGVDGLGELEDKVHAGMKVAFSLFPTSMDEFMAIADIGKVMPPKSTWFEPVLLSGLFIHKLS
ncbi:MAG: DUF1015 family protein [Spirochaetaceae bacterium]|nr:DUF1015 family protein [Spirochaetaceae bacterium]